MEIEETPIQSELDLFANFITYDHIATVNLEFVYDGLIDFNLIKPAEGYEITEY